MDRSSHLRDTDSLLKRIDALSGQLIKRYLNVILLAQIPRKEPSEGSEQGNADRNAVALNTVKMDIEAQALVRTAEDILSLTRQMKELWLFGPLDTMGKSGAVEQTEDDARAVARLIEDLIKKGDFFGGRDGLTSKGSDDLSAEQ